MTDLPGNPYFDSAESELDREGLTSDRQLATEHRQMAQVAATLALAFEQRTANLIALSGQRGPSGHPAVLNDLWEHLMEDIATRIGLDEVQS